MVRSGRAMRRGSMSRVENRVGRCCGTKKKEGLRGKGRWNWRMRRLKKPALFPSPSFNSVPLFFSFFLFTFWAFGLPSSPWLLVSSLSCSRPAQSVSITVREGVEEKERGGKGGCVRTSSLSPSLFLCPFQWTSEGCAPGSLHPFSTFSLRREGRKGEHRTERRGDLCDVRHLCDASHYIPQNTNMASTSSLSIPPFLPLRGGGRSLGRIGKIACIEGSTPEGTL